MYNWISILDAVRVVVCLFGVFFGILETRDAGIDLKLLKLSGLNGSRLLVAKSNRSNEQLRLVIQVIFLILAVQAVWWPMAYADVPPPLRVLNGRVLLLIATICLTVKSWIDRHTREQIFQHWRDETKAS